MYFLKNKNRNYSFWLLESWESSVDLCVDYSFWNTDLGRCIPKNQTDNSISDRHYDYAPLCNREKFNCSVFNFMDDHYCPNLSRLDCLKSGGFYCKISKTCIPKGKQVVNVLDYIWNSWCWLNFITLSEKICDGVFHCIYGDDEAFEICKDTFPEVATIECIENRMPGINVRIMATPCDGIQECRDGRDEIYCQDDKAILVIVLSVLILVTFFIYLYLIWIKIPDSVHDFQSVTVEEWSSMDYLNLKGDDLANLKVNNSIDNLFL